MLSCLQEGQRHPLMNLESISICAEQATREVRKPISIAVMPTTSCRATSLTLGASPYESIASRSMAVNQDQKPEVPAEGGTLRMFGR
jgi:hypothetical protein